MRGGQGVPFSWTSNTFGNDWNDSRPNLFNEQSNAFGAGGSSGWISSEVSNNAGSFLQPQQRG
jgi:hypothetical protein